MVSCQKRKYSYHQLLNGTETEVPKAAPKPPQKSTESSDYYFDADEGMIFTYIRVSKASVIFNRSSSMAFLILYRSYSGIPKDFD